jgi:hypothetical protein
VCERYTCKEPVTSARKLREQLDAVLSARQQAAT